MAEKQSKTGIIIGRFQVPHLHAGHLDLIATALRENDTVAILIGTQSSIDARNPYSFEVRKAMISKIFPAAIITYLYDQPSDEKWSEHVDQIAKWVGGECRLYHSRDSFKDRYSGKLPLINVPEIPGLSGTKLREQIKEEEYIDVHLGVSSAGKSHIRRYHSAVCSMCHGGINFKITFEELAKFRALLIDFEE